MDNEDSYVTTSFGNKNERREGGEKAPFGIIFETEFLF